MVTEGVSRTGEGADIAELCTKLSTTYSGANLDLRRCTFTKPLQSCTSVATLAMLRAWPLWLTRAPSLLCFTINADTFWVVPKPLSSHTVCVVSNGPKVITNGKLQLGPKAAIVFDGSCNGVTLKDTVIQGAFSLLSHPQMHTRS
jgi:hypothetical protein